jgi:predicted metalloendopeptidase
MCNKTKIKAINKINKIVVKVGYTDFVVNYNGINITDLNLLDSMIIFNLYYTTFFLNKLGTSPDLSEWHMNAYDCNAYYNLQSNEIVFPAAILQPPFMTDDFITNLGSIGMVIAHEISHGFDDQGRIFDENGNLTDWWTSDDEFNYNNQTKLLVEQYNEIKLFDVKVSGHLTLGENLADYTAVSIICNVLKITNNDTRQNYKKVFKAYANIWKQKIKKNELIKRLNIDPHAPGRFRTNQILSNIPEFYETFNIDDKHQMYIEENKRISLWL